MRIPCGIKGELGWSSFEEREAKSKIVFYKRVEQMADNRWPKMIYKSAQINNIKLTAVERMRQLKWRFLCEEKDLTGYSTSRAALNAYKKYVFAKIKETTHEEWIQNMKNRSSLARYRAFKSECGTIEHVYDNTRGSTLLAEARAGFLKTRKFRSRFEEIDPNCESCGEVETLEHVLLNCREVTNSDEEIMKKLGLHDNSMRSIIDETKRSLERCERHSRDSR